MKKTFLLCLLLTSFLFAKNEVIVLTKSFYRVANKDTLYKMPNLRQNDKYFMKAKEYLTNQNFMAKTKITIGDEEAIERGEEKPRYKTIKIPNYVDALKEFQKSVDKYNNPLSAYIALQIIKTKIPAVTIKDKIYKRKYIELLYKTTHSCSAYIDYADALLNGIAGSVDIAKAKKVINETDKCLNSASDWEKSVIQMKKDRIKFKLDHNLK